MVLGLPPGLLRCALVVGRVGRDKPAQLSRLRASMVFAVRCADRRLANRDGKEVPIGGGEPLPSVGHGDLVAFGCLDVWLYMSSAYCCRLVMVIAVNGFI